MQQPLGSLSRGLALCWLARSRHNRRSEPQIHNEEEKQMYYRKMLARIASSLLCAFGAFSTWAADHPAPQEATWVARDFRLHTGEVMPQVQLHYRTIGTPKGEPVLVLHGTGDSGASWASCCNQCRGLPNSARTRKYAQRRL
jgi:hypothetical protein